jgi:hypothetical protein
VGATSVASTPSQQPRHLNSSLDFAEMQNIFHKCLAHKKVMCATNPTFQPFFLALKDFAFNCATHTHKSLGQGPRKYLPVLNATSFECDQF